MESKKFLLQEKDIPTAWYNIVADMKNKPKNKGTAQTRRPLPLICQRVGRARG